MRGEAAEIDGEENYGNCLSSLMDDGSTESHKYYLARKTMLEMLRDRGFAVPNCEIDVSLQEFRDKYGQNPADTAINELRIAALHKDDPSIKVSQFLSLVFFNFLK